jgi:predicted enzyme related to lactoylglutathione lyase
VAKPAPIVHFEFGVRDIAKAKSFYGPLFGWEFLPAPPQVPTAMIGNIGPMAPGNKDTCQPGIGGHINSLGHPPHTYCVVYAQVDDLKATIAQAEKLGGKALVPPTEIPNLGSFAWISDPEGNTVGLWKPVLAK